MAKHDRRETSGQAHDSRPVTIQVPLPVLSVVHGFGKRSTDCASRRGCRSWRR